MMVYFKRGFCADAAWIKEEEGSELLLLVLPTSFTRFEICGAAKAKPITEAKATMTKKYDLRPDAIVILA